MASLELRCSLFFLIQYWFWIWECQKLYGKIKVKKICVWGCENLLNSQSHCRIFNFSNKGRKSYSQIYFAKWYFGKTGVLSIISFFKILAFQIVLLEVKGVHILQSLQLPSQTHGTLQSLFIQLREVFIEQLMCSRHRHRCWVMNRTDSYGWSLPSSGKKPNINQKTYI